MIFYIVAALFSYLPLYAVMTRNKNREHIRRGKIILSQKKRLVNRKGIILLYIIYKKSPPQNAGACVYPLYNRYQKHATLDGDSAGLDVIAEKHLPAGR